MSEITEIIFAGSVVLLGAWGIKKYFDTWQPENWQHVTKTCVGPICWATYGPSIAPIPSQNPGGGAGPANQYTLGPGLQALGAVCNLPGMDLILPPCATYRVNKALCEQTGQGCW